SRHDSFALPLVSAKISSCSDKRSRCPHAGQRGASTIYSGARRDLSHNQNSRGINKNERNGATLSGTPKGRLNDAVDFREAIKEIAMANGTTTIMMLGVV